MPNYVNLENFERGGNKGDRFVRDPDNGYGGFWTAGDGFNASGSVSVDFGVGPPSINAVTVNVVDGTILDSSLVVLGLALGAGRATDELELDNVDYSVGVITPGVGFTVVITPAARDSVPHGKYTLFWARK